MSGRVAIVTGASQGIGRATAVRLARDFRAVALVARNRDNLEETAGAVRAAGARALVVVEHSLTAFGRIDALLNVAGAVPQVDLFEMTDAQWEDGLALKLHGVTRFPGEAGIARYGEPEEIAELMAFLVSPSARWMTGSTLRMDGGEVKSI
jgi:NAD(P)-dependent dehydrogenase (short-subunit alcohol dehydrogenase family)